MRIASRVCLSVVVGCGSSGNEAVDAGAADASLDAAVADGGAFDASGDAPPPSVGVACADAIDSVYVTPSGLPALAPSGRGDVVRCATDTVIDPSTMAIRLAAADVANVTASSGATTFRIAYRTTRFDGSAGASTARVYLPTSPRVAPLPVVVVAHGTLGLADACAPSHYEILSDYLVLAYVAHGYAVIATDYAGLGNEGTQGYLDNKDTGQSTLDAARAMRKLVPSGLSNKTFVVGHSQGGGAVLSAQALARSYGEGDVVGGIAFAPGWQTKVDVSGYGATTVPTTFGGGLPAVFASLAVDAYFANRLGTSHEGDGFGASARASVVADIGSQCIIGLAVSIPQTAPTFGDLFDATFRATVLDCAAGRSCVDPGKSYLAYLRSNILTSDRTGARVLVVAGLSDTIATPASVKCVLDKITSDGLSPQVCTDMAATHLDVTQRNAKLALDWMDAKVDGLPPPTCDGSGLPACQ
jgi:dienelactone hydrolase